MSNKEIAHYHFSTFSLLVDWHITVQVSSVSATKMPMRMYREILRKKIPKQWV